MLDNKLGTVKIGGGLAEYVYSCDIEENGVNLHKVAANTKQQGHCFFIPNEIANELLTKLAETFPTNVGNKFIGGKQLYEQFRRSSLRNNCLLDEWNDLDENDREKWHSFSTDLMK